MILSGSTSLQVNFFFFFVLCKVFYLEIKASILKPIIARIISATYFDVFLLEL